MGDRPFRLGVEQLVRKPPDWLRGSSVGLLSHAAALDRSGSGTDRLLETVPGLKLSALFSPEHGYFGAAPAGKRVATTKHPLSGLPIHSLYGENKRPTPRMLRGIDAMLVDLQDLGTRCYTYVTSLRLTIEASAEAGIPVIVLDRPIPLANTIDGPSLHPGFESFVAALPVPMVYGMTPGETALWIREHCCPEADVRVIPMQGYRRQDGRGLGWPPWMPPSPEIRSWETAQCYPATVCAEALATIDYGRGTGLAFQVLGAPWIRSLPLCDSLNAASLRGVQFHPHAYVPALGPHAARLVQGVRIAVTDPRHFMPARTAVTLLSAIRDLFGRRRVLPARSGHSGFFDRLLGSPAVRDGLLSGKSADEIAGEWQAGLRAHRRSRSRCLLYQRT